MMRGESAAPVSPILRTHTWKAVSGRTRPQAMTDGDSRITFVETCYRLRTAEEVPMAKHDDPSRWDGQRDKPPPSSPNDGGSGGGKHERDDK
ncbi:hypothetical protein GCM10009642_38130 [Nocardiopsis metallicus]